jgi:hypothetical protein
MLREISQLTTDKHCLTEFLVSQTNRTAAECLRQYRAKIVTKKEWTAEEDELLREAVKMYGENWQSGERPLPQMAQISSEHTTLPSQSPATLVGTPISASTGGPRLSDRTSRKVDGRRKKMRR